MLPFRPFSDHLPELYCDYLKYTPHLSSLHLQLYQSEWENPVPWVEAVFESLLSTEPSLQHLTIDLNLEHEDPLEWDSVEWGRWAEVDELLENPAFGMLQTVVFRIANTLSPTTEVGEVLRKKLASLDGLGKLQIACIFSSTYVS